MKSSLLTASVIMLTLICNPLHANDMLMDPMPAANPAPDFNLMGMDGKTHTLEDLKGKEDEKILLYIGQWNHVIKTVF